MAKNQLTEYERKIKRSEAAKRGWETRRRKAEARQKRSEAAKRGWETRRRNAELAKGNLTIKPPTQKQLKRSKQSKKAVTQGDLIYKGIIERINEIANEYSTETAARFHAEMGVRLKLMLENQIRVQGYESTMLKIEANAEAMLANIDVILYDSDQDRIERSLYDIYLLLKGNPLTEDDKRFLGGL